MEGVGNVGFFDLDRIVEPYPAPEFFVTRVGYVDLIPGPCIRIWLVVDHPMDRHGVPGPCELKVKTIMPLETALVARARTNAWFAAQGFMIPQYDPGPLIVPQRRVLM